RARPTTGAVRDRRDERAVVDAVRVDDVRSVSEPVPVPIRARVVTPEVPRPPVVPGSRARVSRLLRVVDDVVARDAHDVGAGIRPDVYSVAGRGRPEAVPGDRAARDHRTAVGP